MDHNSPAPPSQTRSYILRVRLTPDEADLLKELAEKGGISMSRRAQLIIHGRLLTFKRWKDRQGGS